MATVFEDRSIEELSLWLKEKGFSSEIQEAFEQQEMDGEATAAAFATCSGPDCLKDVIPKLGARLKVYNALKLVLNKQKEPSIHAISKSPPPCQSPPLTDGGASTESVYPQSGTSSEATPILPYRKKLGARQLALPDPFPMPMLKIDVEESLSDRKLCADDRKYTVRVLATVLLTHVQKPSKRQCEIVAKSLVRKFPFLKEYHSWAEFIYTRCQNINRKSKSFSSDDPGDHQPKKAKFDPEKHAYPPLVLDGEDEVSIQRNTTLLQQELSKSKPHVDTVTSLMSRTFLQRRQWIFDNVESVAEIVEKYPFMSKAVYISWEFCLIMQVDKMEDIFLHSWKKYCQAIVGFANATKNKPKELKYALREDQSSAEDDSDILSMKAIRCLAHFLTLKSKKKATELSNLDVPYLVAEAPRGTPSEEAIDRHNNQPHIVRFVDASGDISPSHFIAIEQHLLLECRNNKSALFLMIATHYVFNIEYCAKVKDVLYFIQEKVLGFSDNSFKKSSMYRNISASIDLYLP